jgi:hypothetical protein
LCLGVPIIFELAVTPELSALSGQRDWRTHRLPDPGPRVFGAPRGPSGRLGGLAFLGPPHSGAWPAGCAPFFLCGFGMSERRVVVDRMVGWGGSVAAVEPRRVRISLAAAPWDAPPAPVVRQQVGAVCAVPGCGSHLWHGAVAGVCRRHNHVVPFCRCRVCLAKAGAA